MHRSPPGAHPCCVAARPDSGGSCPDDDRDRVLARATVSAVEALGGYAGGVYLRSESPELLRLAVFTGLPGPLFGPWWRMQVNRPYPVAEAYRSGQSVHLADEEAAMRRFPQLMAGLPVPFSSLYEPVTGGPERFGVLFVLRAATPGRTVGEADRERLREAAEALAAELAALASAGDPVVWTGDPVEIPRQPRRGRPGGRGPPRAGPAVGGPGGQDRLRQRRRRGAAHPRRAAAARPLPVGGGAVAGASRLRGPLPGVFLSPVPVHFAARSGPDPDSDWMTVGLYPGPDGVTVTLEPGGEPAPVPDAEARTATGSGTPADRAAALYRPVALAIALTEAVTARQVSAVVTEELLPAFGGRQLAIYLLDERHLFLAWETGFPHGFLDRFDGVSLDVRLPGVETLTTGRPLFFESMQHLAAAYPGIPLDADVGARAFLPLIASGRPVGSCILGFDAPRGFSAEERTVLTALAGLIAQALERARRYDSEAALARGLQAALLPRRLPVLKHVDTVGRYLPGTVGMDVGGDWYDVIETSAGLLALVIGDVQGHGVAAAATMGQLRSAVRAFALSGNAPDEVVRGTNQLLIDLDPGQFASCCYVLLDPGSGRALAARAGHPQPLLRHPGGRTEVLDLPGGVVLGIDTGGDYPVTELRLEPGAVLALYTDGLVEMPGTDIDEGVERLRAALAGARPSPLTETADRLVAEAGSTADRPDDIALLLASRTGGDR